MTHEQRIQLIVAGIFLAVIIVITAVAAYFSSHGGTSNSTSFKATQTSAITSGDHTHGAANAKVSLIEYGDYECPACGAYEPIVEQLYQQYKGQVLFVFRNFPLYQIHPFGMISAQATEAANLQGKYWEMHDLLYSKQTEWISNATLTPADVVSKYFNTYAQSLGLNVTQFDADINSDTVKAKVQADLALGNAAQVDHTPTFFINLTQIANPSSLQNFQNDLNAAIASSTGLTATIPTGTSTSNNAMLRGATSTTK
jgi:protein-disulfide isomerase